MNQCKQLLDTNVGSDVQGKSSQPIAKVRKCIVELFYKRRRLADARSASDAAPSLREAFGKECPDAHLSEEACAGCAEHVEDDEDDEDDDDDVDPEDVEAEQDDDDDCNVRDDVAAAEAEEDEDFVTDKLC
jgi:hypothetical protein